MHGFFFAGEEQVQIGGGSVERARGEQEADAEDTTQAGLKRGGKVAHEPESHAAEIASGEGGQQEHDDGGKKRRADDAGEKQSAAIDLPFAAAEEINGGDGGAATATPTQRADNRTHPT